MLRSFSRLYKRFLKEIHCETFRFDSTHGSVSGWPLVMVEWIPKVWKTFDCWEFFMFKIFAISLHLKQHNNMQPRPIGILRNFILPTSYKNWCTTLDPPISAKLPAAITVCSNSYLQHGRKKTSFLRKVKGEWKLYNHEMKQFVPK